MKLQKLEIQNTNFKKTPNRVPKVPGANGTVPIPKQVANKCVGLLSLGNFI